MFLFDRPQAGVTTGQEHKIRHKGLSQERTREFPTKTYNSLSLHLPDDCNQLRVKLPKLKSWRSSASFHIQMYSLNSTTIGPPCAGIVEVLKILLLCSFQTHHWKRVTTVLKVLWLSFTIASSVCSAPNRKQKCPSLMESQSPPVATVEQLAIPIELSMSTPHKDECKSPAWHQTESEHIRVFWPAHLLQIFRRQKFPVGRQPLENFVSGGSSGFPVCLVTVLQQQIVRWSL